MNTIAKVNETTLKWKNWKWKPYLELRLRYLHKNESKSITSSKSSFDEDKMLRTNISESKLLSWQSLQHY